MRNNLRPEKHFRHRAEARGDMECFYCGKFLKSEEMTTDHYISRNRGGLNQLCNFRVACDSCNNRKGDMTSRQFIELLIEES